MIGRGTVLGIRVLFALALSAFVAQSAGAAILGTTAFTCGAIKEESGVFRDTHCKEKAGAGEGTFSHVAIEQETTTEVVGTNAKTCGETTSACPVKLKATIAGVSLTLSATGVSASGWMFNTKTLLLNEHYIFGEGTAPFSGATVTSPEGKGCKVKGGSVVTKKLKATTSTVGSTLTFEPATEGEPFGKIRNRRLLGGGSQRQLRIERERQRHP